MRSHVIVIFLLYVATTVADPTDTAPAISSTLPSIATGYSCTCSDPRKIWLDIVFVLDSTETMGKGRNSTLKAVKSTLRLLNLDSSSQFYSRAAVIGYADQAKVLRDFSNLVTQSDIDSIILPTFTSNKLNISNAIDVALSIFAKYNETSRVKTRKVIVLSAASYSAASYEQLTAFKQHENIVIVQDYSTSSSLTNVQKIQHLGALASNGYFIETNEDQPLRAYELSRQFCDANCFCPDGTTGYYPQIDASSKVLPTGGCYTPSATPKTRDEAEKDCNGKMQILPTMHNADKAFFLLGFFPSKTKFWLGYKRENNTWKWDDDSTDTYTNWGPAADPNGDCVYMVQTTGFKSAWTQTACSQSLAYVCQARPCDTSFYCY